MVRLIAIESNVSILSFYKSKVAINIKLYIVLFNILLIATKTELFKYNYRRDNTVNYYLGLLRLLR